MKTFQDFSPCNGLQWVPNGSRSSLEPHARFSLFCDDSAL